MIQVLQIKIKNNKKNRKIWKEIDDLCFKSKNLYNKGLYEKVAVYTLLLQLKPNRKPLCSAPLHQVRGEF